MSKICLAVMFQNEANWLKLHLPSMMPYVDNLVGLDGGSEDHGDEVIKQCGGMVFHHKFDWNFGVQAQTLLHAVEINTDCDYILRLDPDEIMFGNDIQALKNILDSGPVNLLHIRRINFVKDRLHYSPTLDMHKQFRAWKLKQGISYLHDGKFQTAHETPIGPNLKIAEIDAQAIYHYGALKDPYDCHWRSASYKELCEGRPVLPYEPEPMGWFPHETFTEPQPLDPETVGYRAPLLPLPMNYHLTNNLAGDRNVEYGFVLENIESGSGKALDFGSGVFGGILSKLKDSGWDAYSIDREEHDLPRGITQIVGDVLHLVLPKFDLIVSCSAIEHVGLAGRYGETQHDALGDIKAMEKFKFSLNHGGKIIITLPVGIDTVHYPMHRVYANRLGKLFHGLTVIEAKYWTKQSGIWTECDANEAHRFPSISVSERDWQGQLYNLAGFVLEKP